MSGDISLKVLWSPPPTDFKEKNWKSRKDKTESFPDVACTIILKVDGQKS